MRKYTSTFLFGAGLLLCLHTAIYFPSLMSGFFHSDDWHNFAFYNNYSAGDYFTGDWGQGRRGEGGYYRPLTRLYFNLNIALFGMKPFGHHLSNFILQYINLILFFLLCRRLFIKSGYALAAALLFAAYPGHPHAIHWISGGTELVNGFFFIGAIYLCAASFKMGGERRWPFALFGLGGYICSLMSKETAVSLPIIFFAVEGAFNWSSLKGESKKIDGSRLLHFWKWAPMGTSASIILIFYFIIRRILLGGLEGHIGTVVQKGIVGESLFSFLSSIVLLNNWLLLPVSSPTGFFILIIVLLILFWLFGRSRSGVVGVVWFLAAVAPMTGIIVSIGNGGWLLYIPSAGWCIFIVESAGNCIGRLVPNASIRKFSIAAAIGGISLYSVGALQGEWQWVRASQSAAAVYKQANQLIDESNIQEKGNGILPDVVIMSDESPDNFLTPIFNPMNSLDLALKLSREDEDRNWRTYLKEDESTGTLVLLGSVENKLQLREIIGIERWRWSGREVGESWEMGSGIEPAIKYKEGNAIEIEVSKPLDGWLKVPLVESMEKSIMLLWVDMDTEILTEGDYNWWKVRNGELEYLGWNFIFNDPVSRERPRQLTLLPVSGNEPVIIRIMPIMRPGRVQLNGITCNRYSLN